VSGDSRRLGASKKVWEKESCSFHGVAEATETPYMSEKKLHIIPDLVDYTITTASLIKNQWVGGTDWRLLSSFNIGRRRLSGGSHYDKNSHHALRSSPD